MSYIIGAPHEGETNYIKQLTDVPSVQEYKKAFEEVKNDLSTAQLIMLKEQFLDPQRAKSANDLAKAASFKNYGGANLQYGLMAKKIRDKLNYWGEKDFVSYVLSYLVSPNKDKNKDYLFVMHLEVALALKELNWFAASFSSIRNYLPTKADFEFAIKQLSSLNEEIPLDKILDEIERNVLKAGNELDPLWRRVTEKKIISWTKHYN